LNSLFRKLRKNSKALSPVVASIILIAVTVAVSVVVAAWMGGMTIGLMGNAEQASVANIAFIEGTPEDTIQVLVQNSGTTTVNMTQAYVNGIAVTMNPADFSVLKSDANTVTLSLPSGVTQLDAGASYQIKLITSHGTQLQNAATYNP
jgi:flagellin-like protein